MHTYAIDFETYYDNECSLKNLETRSYLEHPLFECYLVSIVGTDGLEFVGDPKNFPWARIHGHHWISHNASFDENLYLHASKNKWFGHGSLPSMWDCSSDLCSYKNWPRALDKACHYLFGESVSKTTRARMHGKQWSKMTPDFQEEIRDYALKDSRLCLRIWVEFNKDWPEWEREVSRHTRIMLRRGIPVDSNRIREGIENLNQQLYDLRSLIPWADKAPLLSRIALDKECLKRGLTPPDSLAQDNPESQKWVDKNHEQLPFISAVQNWRRVNSLCQKLQKLERGVINGRFYGSMIYCGAHTRRWTGGGGTFNLHNIPREEMFKVNFRSMIKASPGHRILSADLSQIEIRTVMWLARDHEMLERIRQTDDIYHPFGIEFGMWDESLGPLKNDPAQRHRVKGMVLGAQFGASGRAYQAMNGGSLEEAQGYVDLYRHRMTKVRELWRILTRGIETSVRDKSYEIFLPSGNSLHYRNLRRTGTGLVCDVVKNGRVATIRPWHGLLIENCAQSLARDIFADRILELEKRGIPVLTHTHDEVVAEVREEDSEESCRVVRETLSTPPHWIPDIPLGCDVKTTDHYEK